MVVLERLPCSPSALPRVAETEMVCSAVNDGRVSDQISKPRVQGTS
jgi:hypothetical protein